MKPKDLPIIWYDELDSTQLKAKRLIDQKGWVTNAIGHSDSSDIGKNVSISGGAVLVAHNQTSGYGRRSRVWSSCGGNLSTTIFMRKSMILPPQSQYDNSLEVDDTSLSQLCFVAAIAIGEAILSFRHKNISEQSIDNKMPGIGGMADYELALGYKWVNDIMIGNKKVAGILLENYKEFVLLGIGVNINQKPCDLPATSLSDHGIITRADDILTKILAIMGGLLNEWRLYGFAPIRELWLSRALYLNQTMTVALPAGALKDRDGYPSGVICRICV